MTMGKNRAALASRQRAIKTATTITIFVRADHVRADQPRIWLGSDYPTPVAFAMLKHARDAGIAPHLEPGSLAWWGAVIVDLVTPAPHTARPVYNGAGRSVDELALCEAAQHDDAIAAVRKAIAEGGALPPAARTPAMKGLRTTIVASTKRRRRA